MKKFLRFAPPLAALAAVLMAVFSMIQTHHALEISRKAIETAKEWQSIAGVLSGGCLGDDQTYKPSESFVVKFEAPHGQLR